MEHKTPLPTGDKHEKTTESGSLYLDTEQKRLIRISDRENFSPDYRVEVWSITGDEEIIDEMEMWSEDQLNGFISQDTTKYLAGHCFDGHSPYGVWTPRAEEMDCPQCGADMNTDYYYDSTFLPGLLCKNRDVTGCSGMFTVDEMVDRGLFLTCADYLTERFLSND